MFISRGFWRFGYFLHQLPVTPRAKFLLEKLPENLLTNLVLPLGEELDRGETLDFDIFELVGRGVHLGDDDVLGVLELLAQLVPDGHKLLAVP
jgi:hypothetical protein